MDISNSTQSTKVKDLYAIAIHGGAGTLLKHLYTEKELAEYQGTLHLALTTGFQILKTGGSSLEAAQSAVVVLEDSPLFNAGKGAVLNADGLHELDASIMEGAHLQVGGITGSIKIKNPILAARKVLDHSPHCLLAGLGADEFAETQGLEIVDQEYFFTNKRWDQWHETRKSLSVTLDHSDYTDNSAQGTVGAVALDGHGLLSSATSTGGLTNKAHGRVSDSAIIGAGTYANNKTCAISTTGKGDYFIRCMTAGDISAMMEYGGMTLQDASRLALNKVAQIGGEGGLIGIDYLGNIVLIKNTVGMFRGSMHSHRPTQIEIF